MIRLDDIAENMNWDLMKKSEILFEKYKIKPVLGVIPINKDDELLSYPKKNDFWEQVRSWQKKGWEIAMHGSSHVYDKHTKNRDYFGYGGKSEFFGHTFENQILKIKKGLKIFNEKNIHIDTFFAPNHTYDQNTFNALKESGEDLSLNVWSSGGGGPQGHVRVSFNFRNLEHYGNFRQMMGRVSDTYDEIYGNNAWDTDIQLLRESLEMWGAQTELVRFLPELSSPPIALQE